MLIYFELKEIELVSLYQKMLGIKNQKLLEKDEDFYHDISILAHNFPSKAFNKEYVDFFL